MAQQRFPDTRAEFRSPNGTYVVVNSDRDEKPFHSLTVKRRSDGSVINTYEYPRNVEIFWNPQGTVLAITDNYASNESKCLILDLAQKNPDWADLTQALRNAGNSRQKSSLVRDDHVYTKVLRWRDDKTLEVKVSGYGEVDPKGFSYLYLYSLDGSARALHSN
ncbi:MAG TPA: hypothetical protein VEZ90_09885 [Blastocatellia bacterium]|nr:hypothetical protein [Blastocatellia bacterium]